MTHFLAAAEYRAHSADADDALVADAQLDPTAFGGLYHSYLPRVYRFVSARIGPGPDAEDLTQLIFERAYQALPRYRQRGAPFSAWLFQIASNATRDLKRTQATRPILRLPGDWDAVGASDLESDAVKNERVAALRARVASLDQGKQEILALRLAAGLSVSEIAAVLGKRPEAVKKQLSRTLRTLKELYGDELL